MTNLKIIEYKKYYITILETRNTVLLNLKSVDVILLTLKAEKNLCTNSEANKYKSNFHLRKYNFINFINLKLYNLIKKL